VSAQTAKIVGRGLVCDPGKLSDLLQRVSYYRFSGYLWWFQVGGSDHQLRHGTTLSDVVTLYEFDLKLRLLMLECIDMIEVWFRSQFTNHVSEELGPMAYADPQFFGSRSAFFRDKSKLDERLQPPTEPFIETFYRKHTNPYPPLWMAAELMSLGLISKWFDNLKVERVRKLVAASGGLNQAVLSSYLRQLTVIRNACAHHNRLWNRSFGTGIMLAKTGETQLLDALDGSDETRIFRALVYTVFMVKKIDPTSNLPGRLRDHLLSGKDEWLTEMDAPNGFEDDALWAS